MRARATSVGAVILGPLPGQAPGLGADALERQSRPPEEIVDGRITGGPRAALGQALEGDSAWIWLLDASVDPERRALEHLLDVLEDLEGLPAPVLLASRVVTATGALDARSAPVPEAHRRELAVAAVRRRLLALRVASRGSLLVHRRAFEAWGLPRLTPALYDDRQWTARVLKHELGLLVPSSVVVRAAAGERDEARRARMELAGGLRLVLGNGLEPSERPWFAFRLVEQALAGVQGRARRLRSRAGAPIRGGPRA